MSRYNELITRLEKLETYVYNKIEPLIKDNINKTAEGQEENKSESNNLVKSKASKHQKAYRPERNYKKRCYIR